MISVIIPTYNRESVLKGSIMSVLNQTYADLELIIADDCSTDNTKALVEGIDDPRLRYLCLDHNQGACAARNAGIEAARGEWIAFQDSDDAWVPDKLSRLLEIASTVDADVYFHRLRRHYPGNRPDSLFPDIDGSRRISHEEILGYAMISTQTIFAKRAVCMEHRFDPKVRKSQDYDWAIRASRENRFYYIDEVLVDQYYQTDSISTKGIRVIKETRQYFLEKYREEAQRYPNFALYQLKIIAKNKTLLGENATEEYRKIYRLEGGAANKIKAILSRMGILSLLYKMRGDQHQKLP